MRQVHFVVVLSLIGPAVTVRADDAPKLFSALSGGWVRASVTYDGVKYPHMTWSRDGKHVVYPGLQFLAGGKSWSLLVGGSPGIVYWNPGPVSYDLTVGEGKEKGLLIIQIGDRMVRFGYRLEKDTLTITGTEKVPAGPWLGDYDISGKWVRPNGTYLK